VSSEAASKELAKEMHDKLRAAEDSVARTHQERSSALSELAAARISTVLAEEKEAAADEARCSYLSQLRAAEKSTALAEKKQVAADQAASKCGKDLAEVLAGLQKRYACGASSSSSPRKTTDSGEKALNEALKLFKEKTEAARAVGSKRSDADAVEATNALVTSLQALIGISSASEKKILEMAQKSVAEAIAKSLNNGTQRWSQANHAMLLTSACCWIWSQDRQRLIAHAQDQATREQINALQTFLNEAEKSIDDIGIRLGRHQPKFQDVEQKRRYEKDQMKVLRSVTQMKESLQKSGGDKTVHRLVSDRNCSIQAWSMWERFAYWQDKAIQKRNDDMQLLCLLGAAHLDDKDEGTLRKLRNGALEVLVEILQKSHNAPHESSRSKRQRTRDSVG